MPENRLKRLWQEGRPALNGWLSIANPFSAEIMATQGYDSLTVDLQHGVVDYAQAVGMFQALAAHGVMAMARVPWLDPGAITKVLDAGALGVICPMINSRAEAERLVSHMRYPPLGARSFGPTRANFAHGADYYASANESLLCFAMIETAGAMESLAEIVSTPGLDGVYVGPADLTLGITQGRLKPGFDREEPELVAAIQRIAETARAEGKRAGIHCGGPDYAARAIGWGYDFATISNDVRLLAGAAGASVTAFRTRLGEGAAASDQAEGGY